MVRVWRNHPAPLLALFLLLDMALFAYTATAGSALNAHFPLAANDAFTGVADALLIWGVWRRKWLAWAVLLVFCGLPLLLMLAGGTWSAYAGGLLALGVCQIGILLTPAVRSRAFAQVQQG
ncbi:MAG: hypothetical protein J2P28_08405 [Actinobacteria bacterium]|nr:hypothetical protein [Actinomycetota bacterium]